MKHKPLSREFLLARGFCCHNSCFNCPYKFMKYSLFLDDYRIPDEVNWIELPKVEWVIVRNYNEFINEILTNGLPENISFDHDLSLSDVKTHLKALKENKTTLNYDEYKNKTGYDCAKWLIAYCEEKRQPIPIYFVHSSSPFAKEAIEFLIEGYIKSTLK